MKPKPLIVKTQRAFAALLGIDTRTVRKWIAQKMPGRTPSGAYNLRAILPWLVARRDPASDDETLGEARRRKAIADAGISENKLADLNRRFIAKAEHRRRMAAVFLVARQVLNRCSSEIPTRIQGITGYWEQRKVIENWLESVLDEACDLKFPPLSEVERTEVLELEQAENERDELDEGNPKGV